MVCASGGERADALIRLERLEGVALAGHHLDRGPERLRAAGKKKHAHADGYGDAVEGHVGLHDGSEASDKAESAAASTASCRAAQADVADAEADGEADDGRNDHPPERPLGQRGEQDVVEAVEEDDRAQAADHDEARREHPAQDVHDKLHRGLEQASCPAEQVGHQIKRFGKLVETGGVAQHEAAQGMIPDDGIMHHVAAGADRGEQVTGGRFAVEGRAEAQDHGVGGGAPPAEAAWEGDLAIRQCLRPDRRAEWPAVRRHRPLPSLQPRLKR